MFRRAVVLLLCLLAADAAAQTVTLTVTNATARMSNNPTFADYEAGWISGQGGVSYTVTFNGSGNNVTSVCASIRIAGTTTSVSKGVNLSNVQWGITPGTETNVLLSTATQVRRHSLSTTSRSASGLIYFKTRLSYDDGPGTYTGPDLVYSVSAVNGAC